MHCFICLNYDFYEKIKINKIILVLLKAIARRLLIQGSTLYQLSVQVSPAPILLFHLFSLSLLKTIQINLRCFNGRMPQLFAYP
jgi:hypothetical protein